MVELTEPLESASRKKIDATLINLGWEIDEFSPDCNVFTERAKTREQARLLGRRPPDYTLYRSGSDEAVAIVEAKRSGKPLTAALGQAVEYADLLQVPIVFASDGSLTEARYVGPDSVLRLDGDLVTDLIPENLLLRFIQEGPSISSSSKASLSKQQLIDVFADANKLLRTEGLREGVERFTEFSNLLFLKLISEIEDDKEQRGEERMLERRYCWAEFCGRRADDMLDYINDTILPRLVQRYNHSSDVFQKKLLIQSPLTLKSIVDKLSALTLLDADSDIKGDAFEYFLKNSVTVGNDLGEYFTPRHIVRLMVDLIDPRYGETIYDPCCGTGGFLIYAFEYVKKKVLPSDEAMKFLRDRTMFGRELTGTAKIAKMNMILTGDGHTT
jgi:type I restriction enzyme M protein